MIARSDATEAGIRIGKQRRAPTAEELAAYTKGDPRVAECFYTGLRRGRQATAELEQLGLRL